MGGDSGDDRKDPRAPSPEARAAANRRDFLKLTGLTLSAAGLPIAGCQPVDEQSAEALNLQEDFNTILYRPEDMLALGFGFVNLRVSGDRKFLERRNGNRAAYLIVHHQPQHVLERAYQEPLDGMAIPPEPPPIPSRIAGRSRVVFKVPTGVDLIDYDDTKLLEALARWEMNVALNATPPDPPPPIFFARPVLDTVSLAPSLVSVSGPAPIVQASATQQAVVMCQDDGQPPVVDSDNAIAALRNTAAYRLASAVTGYDFFPVKLPELVLKPTIPREPGTGETAIELPFRLLISPNTHGRWAHATIPVPSARGRVELWHTRLGVRALDKDGNQLPTSESSSFYRTIRALWTRDFDRDDSLGPTAPLAVPSSPLDPPFDASLRPLTRSRIVHQTSNFTLTIGRGVPWKPRAVQINRLMLTSLGAWFDARGDFGDTPPLGLSLWEHKATFGRDHYVKVVTTGVLYPFGHRCVLVTISERKLKTEAGDNHPHTAYVRKRRFIVVKQPVMQYENGRGTPGSTASVLRMNPFTMIHIKTPNTPDMASADITGDEISEDAPAFWPTLPGSQVFRFECEALDIDGNLVTFTTPAYFISTLGGTVSNTKVNAAKAKFNDHPVTRCDTAGQRLAYAPASNGRPDDATFETRTVRFEGEDIPLGAAGYQFQFLPVVGDADLSVGSVRALTGTDDVPRFSYDATYVAKGFGAENAGEVLLAAAPGTLAKADFAKKADRSGGLVAPSLQIAGISRKIGPVAGSLATAAAGNFDPMSFFGGVEALLFGSINLFDIIPAGKLLEQAPKFVEQKMNAIESFIQEGKAFKAAMEKAASEGKASAAALGVAAGAVLSDVVAILASPLTLLNPAVEDDLTADLGTLSTALGNALPAVQGWTTYTDAIRADLERRVKALQSVIGVAEDFVGMLKKVADGVELARNLHVHLEWRPGVTQWPGGGPSKAIFLPEDAKNTLLLSLDLRGKDQPGGEPAGFDMICGLEKFKLQLIAPVTFMKLNFKKVQMKVQNGKKPEIDVQFVGFEFGGVLSFVKTLMDVIPMDGFSDPPTVEVSSDGIKAGFNLGLPALAVGVFSLRNISLGAGFHVPFIGKPLTVSFNFCTRENPFELTVWGIGGGGFFGITLYPKGVYMLEAALELGAALSLDFGVASGSVEIKAGIYFRMELDNTVLSGYLRIRGEVDVLCLISASIELYMDLTYESSGNKVIGHASLEIEVEVLFFSASVKISVQKKFAGDNSDPSFDEIMGPDPATGFDPWAEYLNAFATAA